MFSSDFGLASPEHYDFEAYVIPSASVSDKKSKTITIYPNPTKDILNISAKKNTKIKIYNSIGALVFQKEVLKGNNIINIAYLSKGVYYLKTSDNFVGKIVLTE